MTTVSSTKVNPTEITLCKGTADGKVIFNCLYSGCKYKTVPLKIDNKGLRLFSFRCPGCDTPYRAKFEKRKKSWEERTPAKEKKACVIQQGRKFPCKLINITNGGACIETNRSIRKQSEVGGTITLEYALAYQTRKDEFYVRWKNETSIGLQYVMGDKSPNERIHGSINWR